MAAKAKKDAADAPLEDQPVADLKKQADDRDVDVEGSGKGGRVLKADLVEALDDGPVTDGERDKPEPPNDARSNPELAQPKRDKALEEVREVVEAQRLHWRFHNRTEITHEIQGVADEDGGEAGKILIQSVGGRVYVSCTANEVVLDHDGSGDAMRKFAQAFQAAS